MFKFWHQPAPCFVLRINQQRFNINADDTLLHSALSHGIAFAHGCRAGGCGLCKCRLISGRVRQLPNITVVLSAQERQEGIIYACCNKPLTDVEIDMLDTPETP